MAFPRWQPGFRNEQVKFELGLKWPTITLTLVQTRFESQGKFLNFYKIYEYFRKIFLFFGHTLIFHFKKFFLMKFHEVYECFRKIFLFLSHIDFSLRKFLFMNFHEVYKYFPKIFLFFSHILIFHFLWRGAAYIHWSLENSSSTYEMSQLFGLFGLFKS